MHWNQIWKSGCTVAALSMSLSAFAAANGVTVSIAPAKTMLGKNDDVVMNVTMTNTSSTPQYVLKWHTPFDGVEEPLFSVTRDGAKVHYLGAHYKRPAPTAADYYLLKPGASHTSRVELSALYDMSVTGDYTVTYDTASTQLFTNAPAVAKGKPVDEIKSDTVTLWIDGRQARGTQVEEPISLAKIMNPAPAAGSLSFSKCTTTQQNDIVTAVSTGLQMASGADAYMQAGTIGPRYTKWFGANDAGRVATVKAHYVAIKDAFANKPITVDCGCKKTYYAYVYPTQPYTIYVCKAFWTAPMTGTDSKGGTLVHEMSHFNATAGTDDWVYGQSGAASLAISNPTQAIDNADSHEYFGENTPSLQ